MGQTAIEKQLDACYFKFPQLVQTLSKKNNINFDQVKKDCVLIGEGYSAKIYLYKKLNIVLKILKGNPNPQQILRQIIVMNQVNSIWPNLFQYLVSNNSQSLIGFSMIYFQGKRIWQAYRDPQNIYFTNPQSRVRLVKKVKDVVKKLQQIGICHGDLHIDNIMIKQPDKKSEQCELLVIDYGLAFEIDTYAPQKPSLTGWAFMKPQESKTGYFYNTAGLNAYMLGRVALQILLLQSYDDYSHLRSQSPQRQLELIDGFGFHPSVRRQIELYLDKQIDVRNKALMQPSTMQECVLKTKSTGKFQPDIEKYGWSLVNLVRTNEYDSNYYVRNPQKLGYNNHSYN